MTGPARRASRFVRPISDLDLVERHRVPPQSVEQPAPEHRTTWPQRLMPEDTTPGRQPSCSADDAATEWRTADRAWRQHHSIAASQPPRLATINGGHKVRPTTVYGDAHRCRYRLAAAPERREQAGARTRQTCRHSAARPDAHVRYVPPIVEYCQLMRNSSSATVVRRGRTERSGRLRTRAG